MHRSVRFDSEQSPRLSYGSVRLGYFIRHQNSYGSAAERNRAEPCEEMQTGLDKTRFDFAVASPTYPEPQARPWSRLPLITEVVGAEINVLGADIVQNELLASGIAWSQPGQDESVKTPGRKLSVLYMYCCRAVPSPHGPPLFRKGENKQVAVPACHRRVANTVDTYVGNLILCSKYFILTAVNVGTYLLLFAFAEWSLAVVLTTG